MATPTSICSTTRRFSGSTSAIAWNVGNDTSRPSGAHARPAHGHLPAAQHHLAADGAGARGTPLGDMRIARPAEGDPILFQHRFQHLQARTNRELEQLAPGIDQQIDQRQMAGRFNSEGTRDCARLLHGGSFAERRVASVWSPLVYHEQ